MKPVRSIDPVPMRGAATARPPAREGRVGLEAVWPRRPELEELRRLLGPEVDDVVRDVLERRVAAPVWQLADRGGGRWRPAIAREAFLACGGEPPPPDAVIEATELLHTGSLVIDDIQDEASERRGGPAAHVEHGVSTALNAANTAYFRALHVLRDVLPDDRRLRALDMLAEELFTAHLGQALDLALGARMLDAPLGTAHHRALARAKTGALVRIAARLGAIAAGAPPAAEAALAAWASDVGVAYQIRNDLDDVAGDMHDAAARRPSYPLLLILEDGGAAATTLRALVGSPASSPADVRALRDLCTSAEVERRGREAARAAAERALAALAALPASEARETLGRMTRDLAGA